MLQYLLTGLAGIALGIAAMRVWQMREPQVAQGPVADEAAPIPDAAPAANGSRTPRGTRIVLIGAGVLVAAAVALIVLRPNAGSGTSGALSALPAAMPAASATQVGDVDTMIQKLADRLKQNPDDGEGFRMLGWSYTMTGHPEKAIAPYKRALELLPDKANVHTGYAEALVGIAGGKVTDEAKREFDKALSLDKSEPRARYFLALWQAQHGGERQALDKWIALANEGPADAPWQADVRRQITATSAKLGVDVSKRIKAAPAAPPTPPMAASEGPPALDPSAIQAANAMAPADRQAMIDSMVDKLAARLKANPADPDGWAQLLRSRMVLEQPDQARSDLAAARKALANDSAGLGKVNAAASQLAVPGA